MSSKTIYIVRGVPGSGKTTYIAQQGDPLVASADKYFIRPDGTYDWNPKLLRNAHDWCYKMARKYATDGFSFFVDNTNIKKIHYQKYLELAKEFKYEVREVVVGSLDKHHCELYAERNKHRVSLDTILRMAKDFE